MSLFDCFKRKSAIRQNKIWQYPFTGNLAAMQDLCKGFSAADTLYWQSLASGWFTVYDGALRLFSVCDEPTARNVIEWNRSDNRKTTYQELLPESIWCFGEDVFGNQFCFVDDGIFWLETETGKLTRLADTFTEWKAQVDGNSSYYTGHPFASAWHDAHDTDNPLTPDKVLRPITPFAAGSKYKTANLFPVDATEAMRFGGNLANQIKNLPDGTKIKLQFTE